MDGLCNNEVVCFTNATELPPEDPITAGSFVRLTTHWPAARTCTPAAQQGLPHTHTHAWAHTHTLLSSKVFRHTHKQCAGASDTHTHPHTLTPCCPARFSDTHTHTRLLCSRGFRHTHTHPHTLLPRSPASFFQLCSKVRLLISSPAALFRPVRTSPKKFLSAAHLGKSDASK